MRAIQGQAPPIEVAGKQYVFRKLKRKECHRVLYNLVQPFITIVSTLMQAIDLKDLRNLDSLDFGKIDISVIGQVFDALPFDRFWELACSMLNGVVVDGKPIEDLDESEYYDDKQIELIQAIFTSIKVNYPFLTGWIKPAGGSKGSSPSKPGASA